VIAEGIVPFACWRLSEDESDAQVFCVAESAGIAPSTEAAEAYAQTIVSTGDTELNPYDLFAVRVRNLATRELWDFACSYRYEPAATVIDAAQVTE